jgi:hypothetical protein
VSRLLDVAVIYPGHVNSFIAEVEMLFVQK